MESELLRERYLNKLGDLYDAERQATSLLPQLREVARGPLLREALARHCEESRFHLARLELIFVHWGARVPVPSGAGLVALLQEAADQRRAGVTDEARDALVIDAARRAEREEISRYAAARALALRLHRSDEARLLQATLEEEGRAERQLAAIAGTIAGGSDHEPPADPTVARRLAERRGAPRA